MDSGSHTPMPYTGQRMVYICPETAQLSVWADADHSLGFKAYNYKLDVDDSTAGYHESELTARECLEIMGHECLGEL